MGSNYIFSIQPTFTQGLILGQLSIIVLLGLILKYLFLDSTQHPFETSSYHPRLDSDLALKHRKETSDAVKEEFKNLDAESTEWFNSLLQQMADVYRAKLRGDLSGLEGDEIARRRVEEYANKIRPQGFLDYIKVHSVDLGIAAPRLANARLNRQSLSDLTTETGFDMSYTDTISVSLSTSYLFNYPLPSFARLPVSLTISLSQFKSAITITPPSSSSAAPVLTLNITPDFILDLVTTSLMGSRAKLANVPKLHELIQHQVRRILAARSTWKIVLPGLASVAEAKSEAMKEMKDEMLK